MTEHLGVTADCISDGLGAEFSFSSLAERRAIVERLYLMGHAAKTIGRMIGVDQRTIQADLDYITEALSHKPDTEGLRRHFTSNLLDVLAIALQRHRDGNVTEGRLAIDAIARASKLHGLDETSTEREVGEAWADFLARVRGEGE